MPRREGLRDDDILGRLADLETRMDGSEMPAARRSAMKHVDDEHIGVVPVRDERRDTVPPSEQLMIEVSDRDAGPTPPDSFGGVVQDDNAEIISADDRDLAESDLDDEETKAEKAATKKRRAAARKAREENAPDQTSTTMDNPFATPERAKE